MSDLINRNDIEWHDYLVADGNGMYHNEKVAYKSEIDIMPSAEPERKKGRWIYDENGMDWNLGAWVCDQCHVRNDNIPPSIKFGNEYRKVSNPNMWQGSRFCPNCGADMRGEG